MDRFESMAVFVEVVEAGGLSAAAQRRGLSPTMVGKHLRALETRLGVRLLHRTTRRQHLTEAGELYLDRCRALLSQVAEAEDAAAAVRGAPAGLLRIGAPTSFGVARLAPALADFLAAHPRIEAELVLADRPADPVGDGLDLAFRVGPLPDSGLIARTLQPYRVVLCAAPDYLARRGVPAAPHDLAAHDCLGLTHWGRRYPWRFNGPDGGVEVEVRFRLRIDNGPALREAALAGAGVILQPLALVEDDLAAGRLVRLLPDYETRTRPMYLLHAPDRDAPAKLRAFVAFAVERFGAKV
jgi:DNA-binding transcriptional LysR family regulator